MKNIWTRWAVLLISIIFLSSCGGSTTSTPTPLTPEGISGGVITPVPLMANIITPPSNIYINGHVGNTTTGSKSYYQATGLTTGRTYTITLYGLSADTDLLVYNDRPFDYFLQPNQFPGGCSSRNGGTANEQCVVTATSGTMNIEIDGQYALSGATYSISLIQISPSASAAICGGTPCFDFETGNIPSQFVLTETGSGTLVPWDIANTSATAGIYSIHSGAVTNGQISCFSYTAATTSTTNPYVTFNLNVASTLDYDLLLFYIDNTLQLPVWSGNVSWQNVMFNTVSGTHTYKWCHSNNNTNSGGTTSGSVWVDDIYIQ